MDLLHSLLLSSQSLILLLDCISNIARVFDTLAFSMANACLCILNDLQVAFIVSYLIVTTLPASPSLDPIPIESL